MNCIDIEQRLDDILDSRLSNADQLALETHVSICDQCAAKLAEARSVSAGLSRLTIEEPSADFESRVFSKVRQHYQDKHENKFSTWAITAVAASLSIWLIANVFLPMNRFVDTDTIPIAFNQTSTVRLMFESQKSLQQVTLSIDLSEGVELNGYPGQKQLTWKNEFKTGCECVGITSYRY